MQVNLAPATFKGYQQIVGLVGATALTPPAGARWAVITTEAQNVRFREDGATTAPTASVGQLCKTTDGPLTISDMTNVRLIQVAATATVNVSYYA